MAKIGSIERNKKRKRLSKSLASKREKLKLEIFANINDAKKSNDFLYFQRRDSNATIKLTYYFND